jgi:hypothetical protein
MWGCGGGTGRNLAAVRVIQARRTSTRQGSVVPRLVVGAIGERAGGALWLVPGERTLGVRQDVDVAVDLPADFEDFKASVLADQADDDQGVYEVWWAANSRYPHLPLSTRLAIAEQTVRELVRGGHVRLVRGRWIGSDHDRDPVPNTDAALLAWATWVPSDEDVVWLVDASASNEGGSTSGRADVAPP